MQIGINNLELIIVDDGSTDYTAEKCSEYPEVRLIQHSSNLGYGAALKTGFSAAKGHILGFLDADGTYPPESLPKLCKPIMEGADVVVGSRRSGAYSEMPFIRRVGNFIWSNLLSLIAGKKVNDPASGMRVFRREVLQYIYPLPDGLNFTPVMSTRCAHEGLNVLELPIPYKERVGRSKLHILRDGLRFLNTIIWTALTYNPVRILGGMGALFILLAIIIGGYLIVLRLSGVTTLSPSGVGAVFAAVVLGIAGVDFLSLGITFNYLVSLFHKRPIHQGLFGRPIFKSPIHLHFWWIGTLIASVGLILGVASFILGVQGWPMVRLWLYLLTGTMLILMGVQLVVFWIILRVLDELSQREFQVDSDLSALNARSAGRLKDDFFIGQASKD
jgi:glycosyltransferase involved in cell wall biosynthesis